MGLTETFYKVFVGVVELHKCRELLFHKDGEQLQ